MPLDDPSEHPSELQLRNFVHGKLCESDLDAIAKHLETCESCLKQLDGIAGDTLADHVGAVDLSQGFSMRPPGRSDQWLSNHPRYRVIRKIGAGGMGEVYLAEHQMMARQVAIKAIRSEFVQNEEAISRFQTEVRTAAQLTHPNIVAAHDAEEFEGQHFLVMEYVDGKSLNELVASKGPLPVMRACNFTLQVARGLRHAHKKNMIHRDIKPSNLMATRSGVVKILDFGLARATQWNSKNDRSTTTGIMMGTADFVAPEQARDAKSADIRSDLYSLGCTLFFILTGNAPFAGDNRLDKVFAHCNHPFPDVCTLREDVPLELSQIIQRLCAKDARERFQNPDDLIKALRPFAEKKGSTTTILKHVNTTHEALTEDADSPRVAANGTSPAEESTTPQNLSLTRPRSEPKKKKLPQSRRLVLIGFFIAIFLLVGTPVWLPLLWNQGRQDERSVVAPEENRSTVILVLSADKFWYADYAPIRNELERAGFEVVVASNQGGTAKYDRLDKSNECQDVTIDWIIQNLEADSLKQLASIVFMGNSVDEFIKSDPTGNQLSKTLAAVSGRAWIASIGRGNLVPLHYGLFNGVQIADSKWIESEVRRHPEVLSSHESLVVDREVKMLSARDWYQAEAFAKKLVEVLSE